MKKLLATLLLLTMSISLMACGAEVQKTTTDATKTEAQEPVKSALPEFEIDDLKLKVLETKYYPANSTPDDVTGEKIKEPIVAVIYEMTGKREEPLDAGFAFLACASANQETKDAVETLEQTFFAPVELTELKANADTKVKKGETIKAVALYTVKYTDSPVKVNFTNGFTNQKVAEMEINLK